MAQSPKRLHAKNFSLPMKCQKINGKQLKIIFKAALQWLKSNQQTVNTLNVFPVPDGDTGTNMFLTMQSAYNEIAETHEDNIGKVAKMIAQGALMGARGNSGVILSQLLRGFARILDDQDYMDGELFIKALAESRNTAYKGVVRPVEGTILTVAKDIANAAEDANKQSSDLVEMLTLLVEVADRSVKNTPELLPILKQAGVVDSGGKGLFFLFEGVLRYSKNLPVDVDQALGSDIALKSPDFSNGVIKSVEPGQDFEIIVDFTPSTPLNLESFYNDLSKIGTSVQVGEGGEIYRMHIHVPTENKYLPIDFISKYGTVKKVYIENLKEQMQVQEELAKSAQNHLKNNQIAVIAISPGKGISKIFFSLGVVAVIEGGQTMNPSTEEILNAFQDLPTDRIIILPNNKNIILTAEATKSMTDKKVSVIPSISVPQGLIACLRLDPNGNYDEIIKEMKESLSEVETGEITTATRSIQINGIDVKQGEVIALHNGNLVNSSKSLKEANISLLKIIGADQREHITIFYGSNITKHEVDEVVKTIGKNFPNQEIELHEGGQPFYQFILSIE
jgi:DAK2 domain fusion protein YloV